MASKKWKNHLFVMLATFLVAGSFLASDKLAGIINPITLVLLRFLGATFILFPIILSKHRWRKNVLSTLPRAIVISLFYSVFFICLFESLNTTTVLNTGTLFTLMPLVTALLSIFVCKKTIKSNQFLVYLFGVIGTVWVVFNGQLDSLLSFSLNRGDLIFIAGVISLGCYSISMKLLYQEDEMIVLVFCTLVGGSLWMAMILLISGTPFQGNLLRGELIYPMLYLIIGSTLGTIYLFQKATVVLGPNRVTAYTYLNPASIAILLLLIYEVPIPISVLPGIIISSVATFVLQKDSTKLAIQKC